MCLMLYQVFMVFFMQAKHFTPAICSLNLKQGTIQLDSLSGQRTNHLKATVKSQVKTYLTASELGPKLYQQYSTRSLERLSDIIQPTERQPVYGPMGSVENALEGRNGYYCHPAVADNSMHIGILAGKKDDLSRVPGMFIWPKKHQGTSSMSKSANPMELWLHLEDKIRMLKFKIECSKQW